jgi:hypothetical protein
MVWNCLSVKLEAAVASAIPTTIVPMPDAIGP